MEETFTVPSRYLPVRFQNKVWTRLTDPTALDKGDVIFDPAQHAHYAGEILNITEANGMQYALIHWYKSADNVIHDSISFRRLSLMYLWWADPCMEGNA